MREGANPVQSEYLASALDWWSDAGVNMLVDEEPTPWLKRMKAAKTPTAAAPEAVLVAPLPQTLASLIEHLGASTDFAFAGSPDQRIVAGGDATSPLMVMIDMPEAGDAADRHLLSGEVGELFDRMLAAINRDRQSIYLAVFSPGRPPGGMLDPQAIAKLIPFAWQHIRLVGPKRLWLMGQTVSRAIGGADAQPGSGRLREINHEGMKVASVASFSPRFLLANPKRKAAAWVDMQALTEGI